LRNILRRCDVLTYASLLRICAPCTWAFLSANR
jgi:hypothetical protein